MLADLHTHTIFSDGVLTSYQLVRLAKEQGLVAVAITDHDTVKGVDSGILAGNQLGLTVIPGIELSTQLGNIEVHILGYYIDIKNELLVTALEKFYLARINRGKKIIKKLKDIGLFLDWKEIFENTGEGSVGRPHIARGLMDKGYVASMEEAFLKYLNPGKPAFVPRLKMEPKEAINLIKKAKGIPVLAHPGLLHDSNLAIKLISCGLMGIEVSYPLHTQQDIEYYTALCGEYNLLATGGSDFHGVGMDLRKKIGLSAVNYEIVEKLRMLRLKLN